MIITNPFQLCEEVAKLRKELEISVPGFPVGKCNEAVKELVDRYGFERVETIFNLENVYIQLVTSSHTIKG